MAAARTLIRGAAAVIATVNGISQLDEVVLGVVADCLFKGPQSFDNRNEVNDGAPAANRIL